jgi:hypothetical protein
MTCRASFLSHIGDDFTASLWTWKSRSDSIRITGRKMDSTEPNPSAPNRQNHLFRKSLRRMMHLLLLRAIPYNWLTLKRTLTNLVWAVVGLICGACIGNSFAYWTAGQDQMILHFRQLGECIYTDTYRGAIIGTLLGYTVAIWRAIGSSKIPDKSGNKRLLNVPYIWVLLLVAGLIIFVISPPPAVRE